MKLYFQDQAFSFELLRAVDYANYRGASIGECLATAQRIKEGDFESWYVEWRATAERVERIALDSLAKRHTLSAREAFLRAHNYYRTAEFFLDGTDPRRGENFAQSVETFEQAMKLLPTHVETVGIPYQGQLLKGYFYGPANYAANSPRSTLIWVGGFDSTLQELYFCGVVPAIERGYNCLIFNLPGQGEALREQHLTMRSDSEVPVSSAIDYLFTRNDVDKEKIALTGMSLGGYFAPRAAAFDDRIKACIPFNAMFDAFDATVGQNPQLKQILSLPNEEKEKVLTQALEHNPTLRWMVNNGRWVFGLDHAYELFDEMKKFTLRGVAERIKCPVLLTFGEADHFAPANQLQEMIDAVKAPKTVRVFTAAEGAEEHCQVGNRALFHQVMFDWLDEQFQL